MKKIVLLTLLALSLLLPLSAGAQIANTSLTWTHTFTDSDSLATTKIADTSYTDPFRLGTYSSFGAMSYWDYINFYWRFGTLEDTTGYTDTTWTADTMFLALQTGYLRKDGTWQWTVITLLDTCVAKDSSASTVILRTGSTTVYGDWARFRLIRRDSLEVAVGSGTSYGNQMDVYIRVLQ